MVLRIMKTAVPSDTISGAIACAKKDLQILNQQIHRNPELGFKEYKAHDNIVALLWKLGFEVTPHAYGIATSFEAEYGSGGRLVVFNAEYDALPGIGHACGHNLITVSSFAAFVGAAAQLRMSRVPGRVRLLGTPAEEGGGGKALLVSKGAYKDVDACIMAHPGPLAIGYPAGYKGVSYQPHVGTDSFRVDFKGQGAHAGFAPWQGRNALDAVVLGYNGISMLRQQIQPWERIHGIIVDGGAKTNIIPDHSSVEYGVRARSLQDLEDLKKRALKCFQAASLATDCEIEVVNGSVYADLRPNKNLCTLFTDVMEELNYPFYCDFEKTEPIGGSTDQGNVSYVVPATQVNFGLPCRSGELNHTPPFTAIAGTVEAFEISLLVGRGLATVGWRILSDDAIAGKIKQEFDSATGSIARGEHVDPRLCQWDEEAELGQGSPHSLCSCTH